MGLEEATKYIKNPTYSNSDWSDRVIYEMLSRAARPVRGIETVARDALLEKIVNTLPTIDPAFLSVKSNQSPLVYRARQWVKDTTCPILTRAERENLGGWADERGRIETAYEFHIQVPTFAIYTLESAAAVLILSVYIDPLNRVLRDTRRTNDSRRATPDIYTDPQLLRRVTRQYGGWEYHVPEKPLDALHVDKIELGLPAILENPLLSALGPIVRSVTPARDSGIVNIDFRLTSTFNGFIPESTIRKIGAFRPLFGDDFYIVTEADWRVTVTKVESAPLPIRSTGDPLVIGIRNDTCYLIDKFDCTTAEQWAASEYTASAKNSRTREQK